MRLPSLNSREFIQILKQLGYVEKTVVGSHHHFVHPTRPGKVTVKHPEKDIYKKNLESMLRQAGISKRDFIKFYQELK